MSESFTRVEIAFCPEHLNWWLRFGRPDVEEDLDRRRSLALFGPGRIFGYVRWRANEYGTQDWRFTIIQSAAPTLMLSKIRGVHPGGDILLLATGNAKVKRALLQIDMLEAAGFDAIEVSPAYYRHVHNRISESREVTPYSQDQHVAFQAAKAVAS